MKSLRLQMVNRVLTWGIIAVSVAMLALLCLIMINPHVRHTLAGVVYSATPKKSGSVETAFYKSGSTTPNYDYTAPAVSSPSDELAANGCGCPSCCVVPNS